MIGTAEHGLKAGDAVLSEGKPKAPEKPNRNSDVRKEQNRVASRNYRKDAIFLISRVLPGMSLLRNDLANANMLTRSEEEAEAGSFGPVSESRGAGHSRRAESSVKREEDRPRPSTAE